MTLEPQHGARIQLDREKVDRNEVRYAVQITSREGSWRSTATIKLADGEVALSPFAPETPPAWAAKFTEGLLGTLPRKHTSLSDWPRRITRWRQER